MTPAGTDESSGEDGEEGSAAEQHLAAHLKDLEGYKGQVADLKAELLQVKKQLWAKQDAGEDTESTADCRHACVTDARTCVEDAMKCLHEIGPDEAPDILKLVSGVMAQLEGCDATLDKVGVMFDKEDHMGKAENDKAKQVSSTPCSIGNADGLLTRGVGGADQTLSGSTSSDSSDQDSDDSDMDTDGEVGSKNRAETDLSAQTVHPAVTPQGSGVATSVQIFVRILTGKTIRICVEGSDTVAHIKATLQDLEGIEPDRHCLTAGWGSQGSLEDNHMLSDLNGQTLQLNEKPSPEAGVPAEDQEQEDDDRDDDSDEDEGDEGVRSRPLKPKSGQRTAEEVMRDNLAKEKELMALEHTLQQREREVEQQERDLKERDFQKKQRRALRKRPCPDSPGKPLARHHS